MVWFLYNGDLPHERVKSGKTQCSSEKSVVWPISSYFIFFSDAVAWVAARVDNTKRFAKYYSSNFQE